MTKNSASIPSAQNRRGFLKTTLAGVYLLGVALSVKPKPLSSGQRVDALLGGIEGKTYENNTELQVPFISWTWGEVQRGDCTIAPGAVFQLFADGSTRWKCDLRSSDSGDEWDGRFEILNQNGQVLAVTPGYHFDISQENVTRHWEEFRGSNSSLAAAYASARSVTFYCSC